MESGKLGESGCSTSLYQGSRDIHQTFGWDTPLSMEDPGSAKYYYSHMRMAVLQEGCRRVHPTTELREDWDHRQRRTRTLAPSADIFHKDYGEVPRCSSDSRI